MGVARPDKNHYSRNMSMIWGADPADGNWSPITVDDDGHLYTKGYVKDWESLSWVPSTNQVNVSNMLVQEVHDEIELEYSGSTLSKVYYKLSGNVVATLTMNYDGATFVGVSKT